MTFARLKAAPSILALLGLIAFAVLAVRFSPNWLPFSRLVSETMARSVSPEDAFATGESLFAGHSVGRGYHVLRQIPNLSVEIGEPNHKIIRWRLLMPAMGHLLNLPGWMVLGLAQVGCLLLVWMLVSIVSRRSTGSGGPSYEALCFGLIAGASAPFFTSMGLLGYYDSWLAMALLSVAFVGHRWVVLLACVLAPWIDERFVIGFPLALCVRRIVDADTSLTRGQWLRQEALWPTVLVVIYSLVRLQLGGSSGSQTAGQYMQQFVFPKTLTISERAFGIWQGLRSGWVLVAIALIGCWRLLAGGRRLEAALLVSGTAITGFVGAWTALDTSRSMVLILTVVPLGWMIAGQFAWWRKVHAPIVLATVALIVPAWHCLGDHFQEVDNLWSAAWPEASAHNNLANLLSRSPGQHEEAARHYAEALRLKADFPEAHNNFGLLLAKKKGGQDLALAHYTAALRLKPDSASIHNNLANLLVACGRRDEALPHYTQAVRLKPDYWSARFNLAVLLATMGRPNEAIPHYAEVLKLNPEYAGAHNNAAILLASMPERQDAALHHFAEAARLSRDDAVIQSNYARQLARSGRREEAMAYYWEALRIRPEFGEAHHELALVLAELPDRQEESLRHFAEAVRLFPEHAFVHLNYARQLEKIGSRKAEAETHYQRAISLNPNLAEARVALERLRR